MAIDISQDLNIDTTIISVETKTITDIYDTENPPGTYLPGKDSSPTDNVSAGNITSYRIGISLSSKTNQIYPIDKLFLQSVDDPKTNGTGNIPFYYININSDPEDIIDDGNYTIVTNYNANMTSVVLDNTANITSTSTIELTLNVNYQRRYILENKNSSKNKSNCC